MSEILADNYQSFLKDIKERIRSAQYEALKSRKDDCGATG
jgi:hypothetical protein